jgi:hypothetical protein
MAISTATTDTDIITLHGQWAFSEAKAYNGASADATSTNTATDSTLTQKTAVADAYISDPSFGTYAHANPSTYTQVTDTSATAVSSNTAS